ncbi:MAG: flavin reductase [candidate division Zixibacteria bacterium]|nr:flavin reductase [candidate division Zixibacteria bacterium]
MSKDINKVLKKLEYGIYIVTMGKGTDGNAFTASWLTQIGSEPPMVALAINNKHQSARLIKQAGAFAVNLIDEGQADFAKVYYGPAESGYRKLESAKVTDAPGTGSPILGGVVGYLDCRVTDTVSAGNHTLFIAEVVAAVYNSDKPILTSTNSNLRYAG